MKIIVYLLALVFLLGILSPDISSAQDKKEKRRPVLYLYTDKMPRFNYEGGLKEYISKNVKWPMDGQMDVEGTVLISFVVTKEGEVTDIRLIRKLCDECDNEVVNAFNKMPAWEPGEINSEKVDVKLFFSYNFIVTGVIRENK